MKIGLSLPHYDFSFPDGRPSRVADVVAFARAAEDAGFDSVWVSDHLFLDLSRYGGPAQRYATPDAFTMLAAVAAATRTVRLGTLVLCVPFRNTAVTAQQVRSIQDLSGGRLELGLGAGWNEEEFVEAGITFETPGRRIAALEDAAAALRAEAPVWIGGKGGPRIAAAVARAADGWNVVWQMTEETYAERLTTLRAACEAEGRPPSQIRLSVGLTTLLARDEDDLRARYERLQGWTPGGFLGSTALDAFATGRLVGTVEECARIVKGFDALGVEEIILAPASLPFSIFEDEQLDLASALFEAIR